MKSIRRKALMSFLFSLTVLLLQAQKKNTDPELDKVKNMVTFFEYMLNTLGSEKTSARDKDVMVTESYTKIFRDNKVQIEDDLDTDRDVITNKDVPAYLKDVDFFFKDVKFEFTIEDIKAGEQSNKNTFYKVKLLRNLRGTTIEGEVVNNTLTRFMEVNYDPEAQDLKIVSIYTNEFDERAALTSWWNQLSYEWQSIFKKRLNIIDSVQLSDLKRISSINSIDLTGNLFIQNIEPLTQLYELSSLNISKTNIADLTPVRNLTELTTLNLSNTPVTDISPLRYAWKLSDLSLRNTSISDLTVIAQMPALQKLDISGTEIISFEPLRKSTQLKQLNLASTNITNLQPLDSLTNLETLDLSGTAVINLSSVGNLHNIKKLMLDSTRVADIQILKRLTDLNELYVNHTLVSDLSALQDLPQLKRIYCDNSNITREKAETFMTANPEVLVIFDSKDLKSWWDTLPPAWQELFVKAVGISNSPVKEELARITKLDSIHLDSNAAIIDLTPLRRLRQLKVVVASGIEVTDLSPLEELTEITYLDISNTGVNDLSMINQFKNLVELRANDTEIKSLHPDLNMPSLKRLYVDNTGIDDQIARRFIKNNPQCLIVYKTTALTLWWKGLSNDWKEIFSNTIKNNDNQVSTEYLHQLIEGEKLEFKDKSIGSLEALDPFIRLRELHFSGTNIADLAPLANHSEIKSLQASRSPITDISVLTALTQLEDLNLSDTPLEDFEVLSEMSELKRLDCSGTKITKLNYFEWLSGLEHLDCSSTLVRKLDPVSHLSLKSLKCYNTRVSSRRVEDFKSRNPECEVMYY